MLPAISRRTKKEAKLGARLLKFITVLLVVAAVGAVLYYGRVSQIPKVPVATVEVGAAEQVLSIVGRVTPKQQVIVRAVQPGQVIELLKDENQAVTAGELIARVAAEEEVASLNASRAETAAIEAELARARSQLARSRELVEDGFVSNQSLDDALTEVDALEARLNAARAAEQQLAVRAEKFVIRAPIDGLVLARPVDPGQVVSTDTSLFEIGSLDLEIEAEADELYADAVRVGQAARISPAGSDQVFDAVVSEISPRVDPATGSRLVRLEPADAAEIFRPGRTVYASIIVATLDEAVTVSRSAIKLSGGGYQVLSVVDNRIRIQPVEIMDWPGPRVIVTAGLAGGETVVATPAVLFEGDVIRPVRDVPAREQ